MVARIEELFPRSPILPADAGITISKYKDIAMSTLAEASERQLDQDWERAALLYMRVAQLIAKTITSHPDYAAADNQNAVKEMRRIAGRCFDALEDIQAVLNTVSAARAAQPTEHKSPPAKKPAATEDPRRGEEQPAPAEPPQPHLQPLPQPQSDSMVEAVDPNGRVVALPKRDVAVGQRSARLNHAIPPPVHKTARAGADPHAMAELDPAAGSTTSALRAAAAAAREGSVAKVRDVEDRSFSDLSHRELNRARNSAAVRAVVPEVAQRKHSFSLVVDASGQEVSTPQRRPTAQDATGQRRPSALTGKDLQRSNEERAKLSSSRLRRTISQSNNHAVKRFEGKSTSMSSRRLGERTMSVAVAARRMRQYKGDEFGNDQGSFIKTAAAQNSASTSRLNAHAAPAPIPVEPNPRRRPRGRRGGQTTAAGFFGKVKSSFFGNRGGRDVPETPRRVAAPDPVVLVETRGAQANGLGTKAPSFRIARNPVAAPPAPETQQLDKMPVAPHLLHTSSSDSNEDGRRRVDLQNDVLRVFEKMSRGSTTRGLRTLAILAAPKDEVSGTGAIHITAIVFPQQTPVSDDRVEITDEKELAALEDVKGLAPLGIMTSNLEQHASLTVEDMRSLAAIQTLRPEAFTVLVPPNDPAQRGIYALTAEGIDFLNATPGATNSDLKDPQRYYQEVTHVRTTSDHDTHIKIYDLRGYARSQSMSLRQK